MMRKLGVLSVIAACLFAVFSTAAAQQLVNVYSTAQRFEHGLMLWRSDTAMIWVLADDHQVFQFPASSYTQLPDNPISAAGRLRPIFGFGKVWGNNRPIRDLIGWPIDNELGFDMDVRVQNGTYFLGQFDGTVYQVNPDHSWDYAPESSDDGLPKIVGMGIDRASAAPGDVVTIFWITNHVEQVMIEVYDTGRNMQMAFFPDFSPSGDTQIPIPSNIEGDVRFIVWAARKPYPNAIPSEYERLTSSEMTLSIQSDAEAGITTQASYEKFERGFMVWRADNETIYVFADSGNSKGQLLTYPIQTYLNLTDNPSIYVAPLYNRPAEGFGRVWSNFPDVRGQLGYATASEYGFQLTVREDHGLPTVFELPDGNRAQVTYPGVTWRFG